MNFWITNSIIYFSYSIVCKLLKKDRLFLIVSVFHLGFIIAARGLFVGTDTYLYAKGYLSLVKYGGLTNHAMSSSKLFFEYMKLCALFFKRANGYMIFTAVPFMIFIYVLIKNYSFDFYTSIFVFIFSYFYFGAMNTSRQYLAISITFFSFHMANKKKYIISILFYLIAVAIHSAAFPFFLFYIIYMIKWNEKRIVMFTLSLVLSLFIVPRAFELAIKIWPNYAWMARALFSKKLTSGGRQSFVYGFYCLIVLIIALYCILYKNKKIRIITGSSTISIHEEYLQDNKEHVFYCLIAMVALACAIYVFFPRVIIFSRVAMTFYAYIIVLLPNALAMLDGRTKFMRMVMLLPLILFTYLQVSQGYAGVNDYVFFK